MTQPPSDAAMRAAAREIRDLMRTSYGMVALPSEELLVNLLAEHLPVSEQGRDAIEACRGPLARFWTLG